MDEACQRGGGGRLETQPSARSDTPSQREGARPIIARALGTRSPGAWFSRGCMDVGESGYSDPKGVWGKLSSGSCEPFAQSLEAELAKAAAPGESEGRRGHRALEREEVAFPQKRALLGGQDHRVLRSVRLLPFANGGSHLRPGRKDTHPQGESQSRPPLRAMSAITLEGKLYMLEQERAFSRAKMWCAS
jgi:hypothetical protein